MSLLSYGCMPGSKKGSYPRKVVSHVSGSGTGHVSLFMFFNIIVMSDSFYIDGPNNNIYSHDNGNVGIGTESPNTSLHIYGSDARFKIQDDDNTSSYFEINDIQQSQVALSKINNSGGVLIDVNSSF